MDILQFDLLLFHFINSDIKNICFDFVFPIIREKYFWLPLYIFIIAFAFFNFPFKKSAVFLIFLIFAIASSDMISSKLIKPTVQRNRPCNSEVLDFEMQLLVACGTGYSFPSSHAANHFAMAVFLILTIGKVFKKIKWPLLIWAFFISLAQVYVGVHFPSDVFFGALLGIFMGALFSMFYHRFSQSYLIF